MTSDRHDKESDFSTGTVVFALLLNKPALGIYTSYETEGVWDAFKRKESLAWDYQIKRFKLDGPAMICHSLTVAPMTPG